ncbi:MAG TPA: hypothetical protein VFE53_03085 [Mucilaginibacter sp.]|jgi:nitrogen-specific signal transduction histidine kinase|nr:hypothetical protein [Mucilaginibacter sp.]
MAPLYFANNKVPARLVTVSVREIRNCLTSLTLAMGMIAEKAEDKDIKKCLDIISRSTDKIDHLVEESLNTPTGHNDKIANNLIRELPVRNFQLN